MASTLARRSKALRTSATVPPLASPPCAMATIARFAVLNSEYAGPIFRAATATSITAAKINTNPRMPIPICFLRMIPSPLVELSEALQFAEIKPDKKSLADNVRLGHEAPDTAVAAVVPVVAHHEVMAGRNRAPETGIIVDAIFPKRELFYIGQNGRLALVYQDRVLG